MSYRFLTVITALTAVVVFSNPASAKTVTLDLDEDVLGNFVNNGEQSETDGISVTFSRIRTSNGLRRRANVDTDGIFFSADADFRDVLRIDLTFNRHVILDEIDIDFASVGAAGGAGFVISGSNGTSGFNDFSDVGRFAFDMGTIPRFIAGETYRLTHTLQGADFSQIDEIVVTAVPVPASGLLLGSVLGIGFILRRTRRR